MAEQVNGGAGVNRERARAAFAAVKVRGLRGRDDRAKYKTQLLKLPARLHANGLAQTTAFYLSAGAGKPEAVICGWLKEWLQAGPESESKGPGIYGPQADLVDSLTGGNESQYRAASAEARALSVWLKRFAEAFIEGEGEDR